MPEANGEHRSDPPSTAQTRTALVEAAQRLFSEQGYASVGIRDIAEAAGANIASINYYFGSKQALYLEAVRSAMACAADESPWVVLEPDIADAEAAAIMLARFVRGYIAHLSAPAPRPTCGMLMLWEAVRPSEAIDDVVREHVAPSGAMLDELMVRLLGDDDRPRARLHARSVLGQVLHYHVFHPFIERLDAEERDAPEDVAAHIIRFSLGAMGYGDDFIDRIMTRAGKPDELVGSSQEPRP
jgi:AcrR family transcriptional regulator